MLIEEKKYAEINEEHAKDQLPEVLRINDKKEYIRKNNGAA